MTPNRALCYLILAFCLPVGSGCSSPDESPSVGTETVVMQKVVATINGEALLEEDFQDFVDFSRIDFTEDPQPVPRQELFRDFLVNRLLLQEAEKAGTEVDPDRIQAYVEEWAPQDGDRIPDFNRRVHDFLKVQKYMSETIRADVEVSLSEVLRYYETHAEDFVMEDQAHVLEILTDDRMEVERIREEIEAGDVRQFKELARSHSKGVTAAAGGDLGFYQKGDLPEDFEKVIFSLKPGEVSESFRSVHGFHLFMIEEWIPRHPQKFFEARDRIFELLIASKERSATEAAVNQMLALASIEIYDSSLKFPLRNKGSDEKNAETN